MSKDEVSTWRLFVACPLPAAVLEALAEVQERLRRGGMPPLRWVRLEGIHLTLKFLGEVPRERTAAMVDALGAAVAGQPSFALALGSLGTFGNRGGPRVLWVGLTGDLERLAELQRRVEQALVALGFPAEERPFSPHLTLARVGQPLAWGEQQILRRLVQSEAPPGLPIAVSQVSLIRSILDRGGARYQELAATPLSG